MNKIKFMDYVKAVEWMTANRDKHPRMVVTMVLGTKMYVVLYEDEPSEAKFEVGKVYEPCESGLTPIRVIRRTDKTIWVEHADGGARWMMRIKHFYDGTEFAVDSTMPRRYKDSVTYRADNEEEWS